MEEKAKPQTIFCPHTRPVELATHAMPAAPPRRSHRKNAIRARILLSIATRTRENAKHGEETRKNLKDAPQSTRRSSAAPRGGISGRRGRRRRWWEGPAQPLKAPPPCGPLAEDPSRASPPPSLRSASHCAAALSFLLFSPFSRLQSPFWFFALK